MRYFAAEIPDFQISRVPVLLYFFSGSSQYFRREVTTTPMIWHSSSGVIRIGR